MKIAELGGVPVGVAEILAEEGIEELYPPQAAAIDAGVLAGENLVASVPTASGKTLMAALAMLAAIERGGTALYIVPLRALATEKRDEFARFESIGVEVGVSTGNYDSTDDWLASRDIIVATSEKVDSLIRNGASWLEDLTCVVADEVHLVDDGDRGPTLEVTLAKLRQLRPSMQVVALSATIGNADEIATWLDAELVDSQWRPIELRRGVHYGNALHLGDGTTRDLPVHDDEDQEAAVVRDTLEEGGSTLVFVNSRRNAEAAAKRLARVVELHLDDAEVTALEELASDVEAVSDSETSDDLATVAAAGAAFHHAGLARGHRELIEDAFRDRLIKVVCATPTLAAGVNTPSRRVLVRDWRRYDGDAGGMVPLSTLEVQQMFGRAGRPGLDPYGEAVLLASSHEELEELQERYVRADPEPVRSKLAAEPALRTHVLATIADGFAATEPELIEFLGRTLYAAQAQSTARLETVASRVLEYLVTNEFVRRSEDSLHATGLGHTVSRLYVDPMSAAEIVAGLAAGGDEPTALGLYHLVARTPDMYDLYLRSGDRQRYTEIHYEREDELLGAAPSEFDEAAFEDWLAALKTACLLEDWANERPEDRITETYDVGPGDLRGKVETADWLLHAAERLAIEEDLPGVESIARARMRVEHGVSGELLDLVEVRNVGRKRARWLHDAGIPDRTALREADPRAVLRALKNRRKTAETILENVGHPDPDLSNVDTDGEPVVVADGQDRDAGEDQSSLGDF